MNFDFQTIKNKYFTESDSKIAIANVDEIKSLILTVEDQAETIEAYNRELLKAKEIIKQLEKEFAFLNQSMAEDDAIIESLHNEIKKVPKYSDADDQY